METVARRLQSNCTRVLFADGTEISGTQQHPLWSDDRQAWVKLGELASGEHVRTRAALLAVLQVDSAIDPQPVYNIEVFGEHVYEVGDAGILVHNAVPVDCKEAWEHFQKLQKLTSHTTEQLDDLAKLEKRFPDGKFVDDVVQVRGVLRKEANVTLNRPLPGMGSGVHPDLPIKSGKKTQGIFSHGGADVPLQSGVKGPGEHLNSNLPGLGFNARQAAQHVEGHAAAIMRKHGITDADVFINYVGGPCKPNCQRTLYELLPSGAKLRVHFPKADGSVGIWEFTGGVPKHIVIQ